MGFTITGTECAAPDGLATNLYCAPRAFVVLEKCGVYPSAVHPSSPVKLVLRRHYAQCAVMTLKNLLLQELSNNVPLWIAGFDKFASVIDR